MPQGKMFKHLLLISRLGCTVVVHIFSPNTVEAESGGWETLSRNRKKREEKEEDKKKEKKKMQNKQKKKKKNQTTSSLG